MTDKEITKMAFEQAEKEAREHRVAEVKEIVKRTLEKLDDVKGKINELREEEKILKLDIEDLKNGKLDLIAERQEKDKKARKVSVVYIIKEKTVVRDVSPWYWPYQVVWQEATYKPVYDNNTIYNTASTCLLSNGDSFTASNANSYSGTINCSIAKDAAVGTYNINGNITNLR